MMFYLVIHFINGAIPSTNWENVTVVPTIIDLAAAEMGPMPLLFLKVFRLRRSLEQETDYYCALIDCPCFRGF